MAESQLQLSLDEFLRSSVDCNSKRPRHDVVVIDSDPDVSSGTNEGERQDELTRSEENDEFENEEDDYRNKDSDACSDSNILCQYDEYESEDLLDFNNANTLKESAPLPSGTLLLESSDEEQDSHDGSNDVLYVCHQTTTGSVSNTSSTSVNSDYCTSSECCGENLLQPFQPKVSFSFTKKNKEDSTDCLMFHGTGIFSGSHFVHLSKKCSASIVEKQQLKACFHQYLELTAHLLPMDSIIGDTLKKDFKSMRKVRHTEKLAANMLHLKNLQ